VGSFPTSWSVSIGAVNAAFFAGEPTLEGTYLAARCGAP